MSTPAAKRRRLDAAASTLSKPFRSPFKSPLKAQPSSDSPPSISTPLKTSSPAILSSSRTPNLSHTSPQRTPVAKKRFSSSPLSASALNADPEIAQLLRTQRELEKQLREAREQLETAEQARKIERESRVRNEGGEVDDELVKLIGKWRGASRQAAEELFGKVRDRVNRMGGPRAWKEMQKKQQEFQGGWDQEEQTNNHGSDEEDGEAGNVEKRDIYAEYDIDEETENEKSQRARGAGDTGELPGQEDEFTMAMMLRTLNVDLHVIGYDKEQQRWTD